MPRKKSANTKIKEAEHILTFSREELFENLTENERKELISNCSLIFTNPAFKRICSEIYTRSLLESYSSAKDFEQIVEGRGYVFGIASVISTIESFHLQYLDSLKKEELFDRQEII